MSHSHFFLRIESPIKINSEDEMPRFTEKEIERFRYQIIRQVII